MGIKLSSKKLCEALIEARMSKYQAVIDANRYCPFSYYNFLDKPENLDCNDCDTCQNEIWPKELYKAIKEELLEEIRVGYYNK